jgi:DNA-binding GntR family transcriptional regulator
METKLRLVTSRPRTMAEQTAEAIVEAAAEGRIRPGERLIETDLAREMNISRVPVREALRMLEGQGVVVNAPHRGLHLFDADDRSLEQLLSVRLALEELALVCALTAIKADPTLLEPFDNAIAAMQDALRRKSRYGIAVADMDFHKAIYSATGNPTLIDMWALLARKLLIVIGVAMYVEDGEQIVNSHLELLAAIKTGKRKEALMALRPHITEALELRQLAAKRA